VRARLDAVREADVVVIGAGAAGLTAALGLAGRRVDVLAKAKVGHTGASPLAPQRPPDAARAPLRETPAQPAQQRLSEPERPGQGARVRDERQTNRGADDERESGKESDHGHVGA